VDDEPSPGQEPSRSDRSYAGLLAALLVTVVVVGAFVGFRALNRGELEVRPEAVDYQEAVASAQDAGVNVVYPQRLPKGWIATRVALERGEHPAWGINLLTADGSFVGLRQEDTPVADLLATYVDKHPSRGDDVTLTSAIATSWQSWSDDGGDHAYSAALASGGGTLLVYGSASEPDQVQLIGLLVTDLLGSQAP
jgi:hypothetical protein